jgi:hypothetical protein
MADIVSLLAEREKTHGPYAVKAEIIQELKRVMGAYPGWHQLNDEMRESLDMIVHKIGRILSGDPYCKDHWLDIEGYSKLVSRNLTTPPG